MSFSVRLFYQVVEHKNDWRSRGKGVWCIWGWRAWRYYSRSQPTGKGLGFMI